MRPNLISWSTDSVCRLSLSVRELTPLVSLPIFSQQALAGDDTFIQTGSFNCLAAPNRKQVECAPGINPQISFPAPFGGVPQVAVTFNKILPQGGASQPDAGQAPAYGMNVTNVTTDGFTFGVPPELNTSSFYFGNWIAIGPRPAVPGRVKPRYVVLLVAYTPPGTNGGRSSSSVVYEAGSSVGSTTSVSKTFKQSYGIKAKADAGFLGNGGSTALSFSYCGFRGSRPCVPR